MDDTTQKTVAQIEQDAAVQKQQVEEQAAQQIRDTVEQANADATAEAEKEIANIQNQTSSS